MVRLITFVFLLHGFIGLQRSILVNEILTIIGGVILVAFLTNKNSTKSKIYFFIQSFLVYGLVHIAFGFALNSDASLYEKLRTLPILYSIFCFYVGYHILYAGLNSLFLSKYYSLLHSGLIAAGMVLGPKIVLPSMFALSLGRGNSRKRFYTALLLTGFSIPFKIYIIGDKYNDLTVLLILLVITLIFLFKPFIYKILAHRKSPLIFLLFFMVGMILIKFAGVFWSDFYYYGYDYFRLISDPNTIWRLMFWAKTLNGLEFHQWLFGIGLGTPIFDLMDPAAQFIWSYNPNDQSLPYTLGLHNSFITFFVRFGILGIVFITYVLFSILSKLIKIGDQEADRIALSVILISVSALFNVVLESALFAGIFWSILGIASRKVSAHT